MLYLNRKCDCVPRCSHATLPPRFCRIPLRDVDNFILHSRRRRTDHKPPSIAIDQSQFASFFRFPQPSRSSPLFLFLYFYFLHAFVMDETTFRAYSMIISTHIVSTSSYRKEVFRFSRTFAVQITSIDPILVLDTTLFHGITLSRLHRK